MNFLRYFSDTKQLFQAKDVLTELDKWRPEIESIKTKIVGSTKVFLNGDSKFCRREECNLGNLITDAMIKYVGILKLNIQIEK